MVDLLATLYVLIPAYILTNKQNISKIDTTTARYNIHRKLCFRNESQDLFLSC